jgi:hypothetical protein
MDVKKNRRSRNVNILHYVVLPVLIIGHEIAVDIFFHYSGHVGFENMFSIDSFYQYITTNTADIGIAIIIAVVIVIIVELLLKEVEKG